MPVHWVAGLAGHMKESSAGASFTSRHHITSLGLSVSSRLSALVMSCRLQVINPVCLSPPVVASTPPAPFALVSDFSGAWLAPVLPPLGRLSHGQSWPQTFFLTLHYSSAGGRSQRSGKRLCTQEFLVCLLLFFLFLTWVLFYSSRRLEGWKGWNTVVIHRLALWLCDEIELMLPRSEKIRLPALAISNATLTSSFCGIL